MACRPNIEKKTIMSDEYLFDNEVENEEESGDLVYSFAAVPGTVPGQSGLVFAACSSGLKRSADGGQTWEDALADLNLSEPLPVTSLVISPEFEQQGKVFAGAPGGIFHSTGGQAWRAVVIASPAPTVSALAISPNYSRDETVFAGTMEDGVFVSLNGGERWVAWNFGLLDLNVMCLSISPDYAKDETLFAGTESGIFRSTNGGRAWREIELPFGYDAVLSVALSPRYAQDHTVYAGTENQGLWVSADEGETWQRLAEETIEDPVNAILVTEKDGLLALTSVALWHSTGGGATWTNRLPDSYADRDLSAVLAPQGFGPGAQVLVGLTDGNVEVIKI
jgi:photosystem II stability/assembly factor-like uncharacterized protein